MEPLNIGTVLPLQLEESSGGSDLRWQARDGIADLLLAPPVLPPGPLDPEDLCHTLASRAAPGDQPWQSGGAPRSCGHAHD